MQSIFSRHFPNEQTILRLHAYFSRQRHTISIWHRARQLIGDDVNFCTPSMSQWPWATASQFDSAKLNIFFKNVLSIQVCLTPSTPPSASISKRAHAHIHRMATISTSHTRITFFFSLLRFDSTHHNMNNLFNGGRCVRVRANHITYFNRFPTATTTSARFFARLRALSSFFLSTETKAVVRTLCECQM